MYVNNTVTLGTVIMTLTARKIHPALELCVVIGHGGAGNVGC